MQRTNFTLPCDVLVTNKVSSSLSSFIVKPYLLPGAFYYPLQFLTMQSHAVRIIMLSLPILTLAYLNISAH